MKDQPNQQLAVVQPQVCQLALQREVDFSTWNALKEIYDGASDEKVALVFDYCRARKMDPLKKPVHIVPVWSNKRKQMVETIWPSITELRMTALRTGVYAGRDETKFGETVTQDIGNAKGFAYPEWAQVTVYRMVGGLRCAFPGPRVYWIESYATAKRDDPTPNSMWAKRTWGQIEKCAEAAALRAAFPEETGGQASAEEMAGREVDSDGLQIVSEAATAAAEPDRKRAAVPKKKGAAAMSSGPIVDTEASPSDSTGSPESATATTQPPAGTVFTQSSPSATKPAADTDASPPPPPPPPPPEAQSAPKTESAPAPKTPVEWPKVVECTIEESVNAGVSGIPNVTSTKACKLGNGTLTLNGQEVDVASIGRVIFDPEKPELAKFAAVSDEKVKLTLLLKPSQSNPQKTYILVTHAEVAEVYM